MIIYDNNLFSPLLVVLYKNKCIDLYVEHGEKPHPLLSYQNLK